MSSDPNEPAFLQHLSMQLDGYNVSSRTPCSGAVKVSDDGKFFSVEATDREFHSAVRVRLNAIHLEHLRQWLNHRFERRSLEDRA